MKISILNMVTQHNLYCIPILKTKSCGLVFLAILLLRVPVNTSTQKKRETESKKVRQTMWEQSGILER